MGFLTRLFGSSKKESLHDSDLGDFTELTQQRDVIVWKGQVKIFNITIPLYISGNSEQLNSVEKATLFDTLKNEVTIEPEINEGLRKQYEEAGKNFSTWQAHFNCISVSTISNENNEISITFEEKESLYQFNVFLFDGKVVGVSIDS